MLIQVKEVRFNPLQIESIAPAVNPKDPSIRVMSGGEPYDFTFETTKERDEVLAHTIWIWEAVLEASYNPKVTFREALDDYAPRAGR